MGASARPPTPAPGLPGGRVLLPEDGAGGGRCAVDETVSESTVSKGFFIIGLRQKDYLLPASDKRVLYYSCPTKGFFTICVRLKDSLLLVRKTASTCRARLRLDRDVATRATTCGASRARYEHPREERTRVMDIQMIFITRERQEQTSLAAFRRSLNMFEGPHLGPACSKACRGDPAHLRV
jgi:hypothetical protein